MMSTPAQFEERRAILAAKIANQRFELGLAYRQLEKPIHYAELGLRGFGFIKRYPWIFVAGPSMLSLVFSGIGFMMRKGKPAPPTREELEREKALVTLGIERKKSGLSKWVGRGVTLFKLYRYVRPFFV